jgi:ribonuclease P protein component
MLAADNRLAGTKNFELVKEKGKLYQCPDFGVAVLKREDNGPSRFGFIISNKISKSAVQRNRLKRALKEAVRQNLTSLKHAYDMVFLAKISMEKKSTEEIMKQVVEFFRKEIK